MRYTCYIVIAVFLFQACAAIDDAVIFNNAESVITAQDITEEEIKTQPAEEVKTAVPAGQILMIDDFNKQNENLFKGNVNAWDAHPDDYTQSCKIRYSAKERIGDSGYCLRIKYDVDSPTLAYNGIYMEMKNADFSAYHFLYIFIKGDESKGFTSILKIEMKDSKNQAGVYYIRGITPQWQKIKIELKDFIGLSDFSSIKEVNLVFEDSQVTVKEGVIYIDNLYVSK